MSDSDDFIPPTSPPTLNPPLPKFKTKPANVLIKFPPSCPIMVAGPTCSGKTVWIQKLLASPFNFTQPVRSVLYCYGVYQPRYNEMARTIPNITFHAGVPTKRSIGMMSDPSYHDVVVLDDLMRNIVNNREAQDMFTMFCHHYNITTLFVAQNMLPQGMVARTVGLQMLYLVLFHNWRDQNQVRYLAQQLEPECPKLFLEAFDDATEIPYGYIVVDCTQLCKRKLRWRTGIFEDDPKERLGKSYQTKPPGFPIYQRIIKHYLKLIEKARKTGKNLNWKKLLPDLKDKKKKRKKKREKRSRSKRHRVMSRSRQIREERLKLMRRNRQSLKRSSKGVNYETHSSLGIRPLQDSNNVVSQANNIKHDEQKRQKQDS